MFLRSGFLVVAAFTAATLLAQDEPKKLTKTEATVAVVSKVPPEYPVVAKQLKLEGTVELEAVLAEDGKVAEVRIVSGNPVLTKAAADAVRKWKFAPVTQGGKAVKAVAPVSLAFKL
jgi:protein TonB